MSSGTQASTGKVVAVLELKTTSGCFSREVHESERLFVGSDDSSDVCLDDAAVAPIHCAILAKSGCVTIEDCYSVDGTFVNERRVHTVQLTGDAELRVGTTTIGIRLRRNGSSDSPTTVTLPRPQLVTSDCIVAAIEDAAGIAPPGPSTAAASVPANVDRHAMKTTEPSDELEELHLQLLQAREEIRVLSRRIQVNAAPPSEVADPFQNDMLEILKSEILDLQSALAERNSETDTTRGVPCRPEAEAALTPEAAEKLVDRLEQLLSELQQRDDQIATLTGLLQLAEEAHRAECDERNQMQEWLRDIEERFGTREQDWQAERGELQRQIASVGAERDQAESSLNSDTASGKLEAAHNVLQSVRRASEAQQIQLVEQEQTITLLRRQLEQGNGLQTREEKMQLAQERAELARQRQELETARQRQQHSGSDETALRLRELRQHLNTIHAEEQVQREERKLSSRLAKLWHRLEGR